MPNINTEALTFILTLALVGQTAYLHCGVDRLGDRAVSIGHRDKVSIKQC